MKAKTKRLIIKAIEEYCESLDEDGSPSEVFPHPVIPDLYGAIDGDDGWIVWLHEGEDPVVEEAHETFNGEPKFLEVTISEDGTWRYPDDPDSPVWHCYDVFSPEKREYEPSKFKPGEVVYPVDFLPNVPGGWNVYNVDGTVIEYWQCE